MKNFRNRFWFHLRTGRNHSGLLLRKMEGLGYRYRSLRIRNRMLRIRPDVQHSHREAGLEKRDFGASWNCTLLRWIRYFVQVCNDL